jgi:hypothetical protein
VRHDDPSVAEEPPPPGPL